MAGVLVSTPFSISAHELERVGVAKFAMMFGKKFANPNVIYQVPNSFAESCSRGFARLSFDSIESTSTPNLHTAWSGHAARFHCALQTNSS
jgi:hypothetical protein